MSAVSSTRSDRQVVFALEVKSEKVFENIFLQNGVLAALGMNGRVKINKGGNRFDERIHLGKNPNSGHRSMYAQIPTAFSNTWYTALYGQAVWDGAAVMNLVEIDQAQGDSKLDDVVEKAVEELLLTAPNDVADALMKTTPTSVDPESVVATIEATAFGSQTSTTGSISRSAHTGLTDKTDAWQNQYNSTAITDISGAAGKGAIEKFAWDCSPGGSAKSEQPDIALTTTGVFAKFTGGDDVNRRFTPNDKLLKLGFDNVLINNAALMADRNVTNGYLYFLNTNYMRLQILAGPKTKTIGSVVTVGGGKQSIQLQVREPIESSDHLNKVVKMYMVYNLTFGGLRQHGLQINITEA